MHKFITTGDFFYKGRSASGIAKEVGISNATIHNRYPDLASQIRELAEKAATCNALKYSSNRQGKNKSNFSGPFPYFFTGRGPMGLMGPMTGLCDGLGLVSKRRAAKEPPVQHLDIE